MWMDVTPAAAEHGLAALAGSAPDVGVAGYTLGGGVSLARPLARAGRQQRGRHRGGDRRRRAPPRRRDPRARAVLGPARRWRQLRRRHRDRVPALPDHRGVRRRAVLPARPRRRGAAGLAAVAALGAGHRDLGRPGAALPADPRPAAAPERPVLRRRRGRLPAPADEADELLAPLRALGPAIDTFDTIPITGLSQLHMDPHGPVPGVGDGALLGELPAEASRAFVASPVPGRARRCCRSSCVTSAACSPRDGRAGGAVSGLDAESAACSPWGSRRTPGQLTLVGGRSDERCTTPSPHGPRARPT